MPGKSGTIATKFPLRGTEIPKQSISKTLRQLSKLHKINPKNKELKFPYHKSRWCYIVILETCKQGNQCSYKSLNTSTTQTTDEKNVE
jgi:hypothetical protein